MRRTHTIALLAVLTVATLPGLTAAVQTDVAVTDVEVSLDQPVPGDEITIESTIENVDSVGFFVDRVSIEEDVEEQADEDPEDAEEYDKVLDIGTLEANDSRTVPLTVSFEEEGSYDLRVKLWGRPNDGGNERSSSSPRPSRSANAARWSTSTPTSPSSASERTRRSRSPTGSVPTSRTSNSPSTGSQ